MKKIYIIGIRNKKGILDVFSSGIIKNIKELEILGVRDIATVDLYRFEGDISLKDIEKIAEDVLLDKIIQEYFIEEGISVKKDGYNFVIDVFYKKGVTDAAAETVFFAIKDAGIKTGMKISTGKRYYLKGDLSKDEIMLVCERVLASRLVQDCYIT